MWLPPNRRKLEANDSDKADYPGHTADLFSLAELDFLRCSATRFDLGKSGKPLTSSEDWRDARADNERSPVIFELLSEVEDEVASSNHCPIAGG